MKRIIYSLLGVFFIPLFANAQFWEVGIMLGGANYSGDLSPTPIVFQEMHGAAGALVRANVHKNLSLKANAYYGVISGQDANSETYIKRARNLSFRSEVLEVGLNAEINFMPFMPGNKDMRTAIYGLLGVSIFKFDPQTLYNDEWVRLQPLGTEGQGTTRYNDRKKYGLTQVSIPFGLGIKHNIVDNWNIGLEFGIRKTFTDYLDDVSTTYVEYDYLASERGELSAALSNRTGEFYGTRLEYGPKDNRGNATNKDWYMFAGITFTYVIMSNNCYRF